LPSSWFLSSPRAHGAALGGGKRSAKLGGKAANNGHFESLRLMAPDKPKGGDARWRYSWAASDALNANYEDIAMYLIELGAVFTIDKKMQGAYALSKFSKVYPELGFRLLERFKLPPTLTKRATTSCIR
jgi:hypothetical protein